MALMCCRSIVYWWKLICLSQISRETALLLKAVKLMFNLGNVLLRYVLIFNLEVSLNFCLTLLQLNVIKMFPLQ